MPQLRNSILGHQPSAAIPFVIGSAIFCRSFAARSDELLAVTILSNLLAERNANPSGINPDWRVAALLFAGGARLLLILLLIIHPTSSLVRSLKTESAETSAPAEERDTESEAQSVEWLAQYRRSVPRLRWQLVRNCRPDRAQNQPHSARYCRRQESFRHCSRRDQLTPLRC